MKRIFKLLRAAALIIAAAMIAGYFKRGLNIDLLTGPILMLSAAAMLTVLIKGVNIYE